MPTQRKVIYDADFHGRPMKAADMVLFPIAAACRDPKLFDRPDEVILDRQPNNHVALGASPHRCLGSHLARRELRIALEEWHRLIPDYGSNRTSTSSSTAATSASNTSPSAETNQPSKVATIMTLEHQCAAAIL